MSDEKNYFTYEPQKFYPMRNPLMFEKLKKKFLVDLQFFFCLHVKVKNNIQTEK